jgi:hypothetical protein
VLPIFIVCGVWLARNASLFENNFYPMFQVSQQDLALLSCYKSGWKLNQPWVVNEVEINRFVAWVFFDGAFQGSTSSCGLGFILHFSDLHFVHGQANLGHGSNNLGEFKALFSLLKFVVDKDVHDLQILGDSKLAIEWMMDEGEGSC